jgi:hypothetical protein
MSSSDPVYVVQQSQVVGQFYEPGMAYAPVVEGKLVEPLSAGGAALPQAPAGGAASGLKYIAVSNGMSATYLLRNDGVVCRSRGSAAVHSFHAADDAKGVLYTSVAAGPNASYAIRSDGTVDRFTSATAIIRGIACPDEGVAFVSGGCSEANAYLLGSNGVIYRFRSATDISRMEASDGAKYVSVSAGQNTSYFVRDDGKIAYSRRSGEIHGLIEPVDGVPFIGVSSQTVGAHGGKGEDLSNQGNYLIRSDGMVIRTTGSGRLEQRVEPPAGLRYLAASASAAASYYVRSDGAVDRTTRGNGKVTATMNPPPGTRYIAVSAHMNATYLLRSDGIVDRTTGYGKVQKSMLPSDNLAQKSCAVS